MEINKLLNLIGDKIERQLPSFYRRIGLDNNYLYVITVQTDDGDVTCTVAKVTDDLMKKIETKYFDYLSDSSIEIAEWIESYIQDAGIRIRSTMWG